jgi:hypothetical protein
MCAMPNLDAVPALAHVTDVPGRGSESLGHPGERVAVVIGSTSRQGPALRHAVELARRRSAPLDIVQILDDGDPLVGHVEPDVADGAPVAADPVLHQLSVFGRLHRLAARHTARLDDVDHEYHVLGVFDDGGRERLVDLLQEVTLTVIGDDSPLLDGTTPEQLALALAEAARCGVVVVPSHEGAGDDTRAA